MKVFACKRCRGYSGGVAIVAANSAEEAFNVFHTNVEYKWMFDIIDEDGYYYKKENWVELPMLTANVEHPQIIIEDGHSE
jgi:hypothetical protein